MESIITKKCSKCQEIKSISEFHKNKNTPNGYCYKCKKCRNKYKNVNFQKIQQQRKICHQEHKHINNLKSLLWHHQNPEKSKQIRNEWKLNNPNYYQEYNKQYNKKRLKNDPSYKLIYYLRNNIRKIIHREQKYGPSIKLLGLSGKEYKQWLESQFYNGMTWNNQGNGSGYWQIHHICPIEFFNQNDPIEQQQCWHYTNTKPLWYKDHCEEHCKINEKLY